MCLKRNTQQNPTEETTSELLPLKFPACAFTTGSGKPSQLVLLSTTNLFQNAAIVCWCLQTLVTIWGMDCGAELRCQQHIQSPDNYKWGNMFCSLSVLFQVTVVCYRLSTHPLLTLEMQMCWNKALWGSSFSQHCLGQRHIAAFSYPSSNGL